MSLRNIPDIENMVNVLGPTDLLYLAGVVDRDRERLRRMIKDNPGDTDANFSREKEISQLDLMTEKLIAQMKQGQRRAQGL